MIHDFGILSKDLSDVSSVNKTTTKQEKNKDPLYHHMTLNKPVMSNDNQRLQLRTMMATNGWLVFLILSPAMVPNEKRKGMLTDSIMTKQKKNQPTHMILEG